MRGQRHIDQPLERRRAIDFGSLVEFGRHGLQARQDRDGKERETLPDQGEHDGGQARVGTGKPGDRRIENAAGGSGCR